ncbi:MAG: replication-associated recombination protein A [Chloroflexi bacterium]|nr:replication-associated recombination protein A [Chloroflexota bacterium]
MRPRSFDQFVGQEHLVGPDRVLRKTIERDRLVSIILWGPPGSGKTTLAEMISRMTRSRFCSLSAVSAGVADLRKVIDDARRLKRATGQRTILFVDEIHRFNKSQQDAVLPFVEKGEITLIGATTENPSFEVNAALLSRCRVFTLRALTDQEVESLVRRALADAVHGLGVARVTVEEEAIRHLTVMSNGDARVALNALELAASAATADAGGERHVGLAAIEDALQHRALLYDKAGDQHYDTISALHKSIRGSDPDAALYWLGRMIEAGEDPLYVARRLIRCASEDVGMADPMALTIAVAAQQAVHFVGMPEGNLALAQAVVYLATAPKSNALYAAYKAVREDVEHTRNDPVPLHIRNPVTGLMKDLGYGKGYLYEQSYWDKNDSRRREQTYLPDSLKGKRYYRPEDNVNRKERKERKDEL